MLRILNISTDEALLMTRSEIFHRAGYGVIDATDFRRVLDACQQDEFDIAVIGHSIPEKEKLRLYHTIREGHPSAVVIELYRYSPDLPDADHSFCTSRAEPEELLAFLQGAATRNRSRRDEAGAAPRPRKSQEPE